MIFPKVAVLAILSAANAATTSGPPPLGLNQQIGYAEWPLACAYGGSPSQFIASFSGTAPVYAGAGSQIYYTDLSMSLTIPEDVANVARQVGASTVDAEAFVNITLTNAKPALLQLFPKGLNLKGIPIPSSGPIKTTIPGSNKVLAPVGPVTMGKEGVPHEIYLQDINVNITLRSKSGSALVSNLSLTCGKQAVPFSLALINVEGPKLATPDKSGNGYVPTFGTTLLNQETGSYRFPYSCDFGSFGKQDIDLTISGTIPDKLSPGGNLTLTNADSYLRINSTFVKSVANHYKTAQSVSLSFDEFLLDVTNSKEKQISAISTKSPIVVTKSVSSLLDSNQVILRIPQSGLLNIGPFHVSGANGQKSYISIGQAKVALEVMDNKSKSLGQVAISCGPKYPTQLISLAISSKAMGTA